MSAPAGISWREQGNALIDISGPDSGIGIEKTGFSEAIPRVALGQRLAFKFNAVGKYGAQGFSTARRAPPGVGRIGAQSILATIRKSFVSRHRVGRIIIHFHMIIGPVQQFRQLPTILLTLPF
jgi:hypothetical protein